MAWVYLDTRQAVDTGSVTSKAVVRPTLTDGGLLILEVTVNVAGVTPACSGFTTLVAAGGSGFTFWAGYRIVDGTEPASFTVTGLGGNRVSIACASWYENTGATISLDTSGVQNTASGTSHASPAVTPAATGELAVYLLGLNNSASANTCSPPAGYAEVADVSNTPTDNNSGTVAAAYKTASTGAQSATGTTTQSVTGRAALVFFSKSSLSTLSRGGTLAPTGALKKAVTPAKYTGTLAAAGAVHKQGPPILLGGSLGLAGALKKALTPTVYAGTLATAGTVDAATPTGFVQRGGTLSLGGVAREQPEPIVAGTMSSGGTVTKDLAPVEYGGELTPEGDLTTGDIQAALDLGGTLEPAGAFAASVDVGITAALAAAGQVALDARVRVVGTLTSAGVVVAGGVVAVAGVMASNGALATARVSFADIGGTLATAGQIARFVILTTQRATLRITGALRAQGPAQFGYGPAAGTARRSVLGRGSAVLRTLTRGRAWWR